ncbi:type II toxin-antitoxin system BrnA family antitoxin [Halarcobacter ebronensis]|uniref:CopG family transcriptional regulator n=1 Tax=Halarcobacter ebronensis TaxID=1462615 RepID=A0A4Q1AJY3_9BACT|nr:CopG family transcriptional regulator [Halarcobacter ebronensis]QKF81174.1 toxin-antitoxin system, antitoxin component, CopG family [Halarcobacter ebronensis]RXK03251.1 CopG family transcriptional regulator [Halarcobacter ebronensis]
MKASQIDEKFDENSEDILEYFDTKNIRKVNETPKRVNIDFPTWMVESLDREAQHIGVSRQAIIKMWLAEKLSRVS